MTKTILPSLCLLAAALLPNSEAFSVELSRRNALNKAIGTAAAGIATTVVLPEFAVAAVSEETPRVTTRMGGLLEPFQDGPRGFRILAPSGWNKFEGEVGAYDVKWQDLVDPSENVKITSSPVKSSTTSIDALGEVKAVGDSLAAKRDARLVAAEERMTDGILFYKFEFAINDGTHQLLQLCVNKGKVWSLDANSKEKRWSKRGELYQNVVGSFMPKLT
ncbi:PsbP-like protein [Seminavis robusta]|uniref:PsbP-like protein n=1 Tax=Seminavis robusta TaxID=568900 RepID=A0A9N8DM89_9STRA|nr:PsbP-like protein [Seminavis robusta]|eukprot:Sro204_g085790.1 PsbP-like protein (219) ;mRNA; f:16523-17357